MIPKSVTASRIEANFQLDGGFMLILAICCSWRRLTSNRRMEFD